MNLQSFPTMHPDLLPGLVNTALRNNHEDLDDLIRSHDLDGEALVERLAQLGYHYQPEIRQFRKRSAEAQTQEGQVTD